MRGRLPTAMPDRLKPEKLKPELPSSLGIIARDIGGLLAVVGALMLVPALVAIGYREPYAAAAFVASAAITGGAGLALRWVFRSSHEPKLRHAMVTAGGGWLVIAIFGALPFFLAAHWMPREIMASYVPAGASYAASSLVHLGDPLHAIFESMSGFTTTGLTMSVHEPSLPKSMLFYRSFTQWIGGAGVLVLALAILRQTVGVGGYSLYRSEARQQRVRPSIISTARSIAAVYLVVTLVVAAYLATATFLVLPGYGLEATLFDAINHAMTGQATGGFSTLDDSIAGYGSYAMELVHLPPMILGAIALPVYYAAFRDRDPRVMLRDPQVRTLLTLLVLGVPTLAFLISRGTVLPALSSDLATSIEALATSTPVREGLFQYVSALTGTGWQTAAIDAWQPGATLFIVLFAMNFGGCAGATTGGIKLIRVHLLAKGFRWQIYRVFLPENAIQTINVGEKTLDLDAINEELRSAAMLTLAYLLFLALGIILVAAITPQLAFTDVLFEVASAQGTVGLSTGITGPAMDQITEGLFIFLMWLGRLEIFPVLAFLRALRHGMSFR